MARGDWRGVMIAALAGVVLCGVGIAEGYILPSKYFLNKYAKLRGVATRLTISQTTTTWTNGRASAVEERVFIRAPAQVRVEQWRAGKRIQVDLWRGTQHVQWRAGGTTKRSKRKIQHRFDLFAIERSGSGYANIFNLVRYMRVRRRGVKKFSRGSDYMEQRYVRLAWFKHAPAIAIGAPDRQLWLHKKLYHPVRFMAGIKGKKVAYDLRFLDYYRSAGIPIYPGRVQLYRNGRLALQTLVSRVQTNVSVPKSLFLQVK